MLNAIVDASLRYKVLVIVAFLIVIGLGVQAFRQVPVDAFPDVTPIQVNVYTESPGLAAEDVEKLLTAPIEGALAGLPGVQEVRSVSLFGLSYVGVYFDDDVDIYFARRLVGEKLQDVKGRLPQGYGEPVLGPNSSGLGQVFWYTVESADKNLSTMDLRTLHDWTVRLILRTAPGVDDIITWGGDEKQFQVQIDPNALVKYKLSFKQVMEALTANNKQVGGQSINLGREQYLVRGLGLVSNVTDIGGIVVAERGGAPIRVRDVAKVVEAPAPRFGAVTRDGKEAVLGMALSRVNENAKTVVDAVKAKLAIAQAALPKGVTLKPIYDRTEIVEKALKTAESSLVEGAILVAVILFLFLGEFRSAIVVIVTLPLSMLIAFILMQRFGLSANLMSLAGLAIGTGMMVDGAVVMVENAFRLLSHARESGKPINKTHVMLEAAREVVNPIAFAILIIIVVFLPLFSLTGLEGKLFKPMALTITFAMAGSLVLSLTLVPVLAALILKPKEEKDTFLVRWAKKAYVPLLDWALERKKRVIGTALVLLVGTLALFPLARQGVHAAVAGGRHHVPRHRHPVDLAGRIAAGVSGGRYHPAHEVPAGSLRARHDRPRREGRDRGRELHGSAGGHEAAGRVARKGLLLGAGIADAGGPGEGRPDFRLRCHAADPDAGGRAHLGGARHAGAEVVWRGSGDAGPPDGASQERSGEGARRHRPVGGGEQGQAPACHQGQPRSGLALRHQCRRDPGGRAGRHWRQRRVDADRWHQALRHRRTPGRRLPGGSGGHRLHPDPHRRRSARALLAGGHAGARRGYSFVRREALQRYAVLQMDVKGRDVDSFVKEADAKLKEAVQMPAGYWVEWGGAFENQQRALARLALIVPLTIGLIFLLLYTAFNSLRHATIIIANVPFAIIGGIIGLFVTGQYVSVPSAIGFIAVFGVAMLNGIVLVSFLNDQRRHGLSVREAVRQGAALRLRPVLMTASVAILGLIPMLLSTGVGAETQRPLATVVVGGLITSTALTLLLLPLIYEWAELRAERRKQPQPVPAIEGATP
jgi:Cu/Ag efflux pump CusA